jgi:hypothetical protein
MSAAQPGTGTVEATPAPPPPVSIPTLEAEIAARRDRLAKTIDELAFRVKPATIIHRQKQAARARFADVAQTPEGDLRVERVAALVAVVAVVGGWILYRRLRNG